MKTVLYYLLSVIIVVSGCSHQQTATQTSVPAAKQNSTAKPFMPPTDSSISLAQMTSWFSCNPRLDSLTYLYGDSFKTEDTKKRLKYQDDFSRAQDRICLCTGLTGGYKEYKWIMDNMGNPRNKSVLDSVHAVVY
jgi:hypothetical protein